MGLITGLLLTILIFPVIVIATATTYFGGILIVLICAAGVYDETNRLYGHKNTGQTSPFVWGVAVALLWFPMFMFYFVYREEYKRQADSENDKEPERQPCPQCGESIPTSAKVCRFCRLELPTEEQPQSKPSIKRNPPPSTSGGMKIYKAQD